MSIPSEQIPLLACGFSATGFDVTSAGGIAPYPLYFGQGSSRGPATGPSNITVTTERRRALRACAMLYGLGDEPVHLAEDDSRTVESLHQAATHAGGWSQHATLTGDRIPVEREAHRRLREHA